MLYKIYKNGVLYKTMQSSKCVDAIIDKFLGNYVKDTTLLVEDGNGKIVYQFWHF